MDEPKVIKPPAHDPDGLLPRQKQFALRFLATGNGTASALQAGYSPKNAASTAWELQRNPKVKAFIDKRQNDVMYELDSSMVRLRAELVRTAYTPVAENPIYQMQLARIRKLDGKLERNLKKLLPTMTHELDVLRKIVKDHEQNQSRAQRLLADLDQNRTAEEVNERLGRLELMTKESQRDPH